MTTTGEKILKACTEAKNKLAVLGIEPQLISEIDWCLGSYSHDQNPDGLYQKGADALNVLKNYKKENPRKVSKKLLEDLEKAVN
ncbi:MAG: hypothetical protein KDC79_12830 [Cyclobacteriaceae bacterium]|nr:hypothetical protein [Cyclobacteriaceae bacterium]